MLKKKIAKFQHLIWDFYKKNKRDFPWRKTKNPYRILVSEIMLQQTQADRVVRYYQKWIKRFPDFKALAGAKFSEIYPYWQGLGYNRRVLNLQRATQKTVENYSGKLPKDILALEDFPGIGPYTARAISIFSFNTPVACIETNIRRVFIHEFFGRKKSVTDKEILTLAEQALDVKNPREWHWALMDYGAYLKNTVPNPNRRHKNYSVQSKFEGSVRQIRGSILKGLAKKPVGLSGLITIYPPQNSAESYAEKRGKVKKAVDVMIKEGFVEFNPKKKLFSLK